MYESPIEVIYDDLKIQIENEFENNILKAIQHYGIRVDKNELVKALNYDRNQYEKGFEDGLAQKTKWTLISEEPPEDGQRVLFCDIDGNIYTGHHVKGWPRTHFMTDLTYEYMKNILAWMPSPEPYKLESEEEDDSNN